MKSHILYRKEKYKEITMDFFRYFGKLHEADYVLCGMQPPPCMPYDAELVAFSRCIHHDLTRPCGAGADIARYLTNLTKLGDDTSVLCYFCTKNASGKYYFVMEETDSGKELVREQLGPVSAGDLQSGLLSCILEMLIELRWVLPYLFVHGGELYVQFPEPVWRGGEATTTTTVVTKSSLSTFEDYFAFLNARRSSGGDRLAETTTTTKTTPSCLVDSQVTPPCLEVPAVDDLKTHVATFLQKLRDRNNSSGNEESFAQFLLKVRSSVNVACESENVTEKIYACPIELRTQLRILEGLLCRMAMWPGDRMADLQKCVDFLLRAITENQFPESTAFVQSVLWSMVTTKAATDDDEEDPDPAPAATTPTTPCLADSPPLAPAVDDLKTHVAQFLQTLRDRNDHSENDTSFRLFLLDVKSRVNVARETKELDACPNKLVTKIMALGSHFYNMAMRSLPTTAERMSDLQKCVNSLLGVIEENQFPESTAFVQSVLWSMVTTKAATDDDEEDPDPAPAAATTTSTQATTPRLANPLSLAAFLRVDDLKMHVAKFVQTLRDLNAAFAPAGAAERLQTMIETVRDQLKRSAGSYDLAAWDNLPTCPLDEKPKLSLLSALFQLFSRLAAATRPEAKSTLIEVISPCLEPFFCRIADNQHPPSNTFLKTVIWNMATTPVPPPKVVEKTTAKEETASTAPAPVARTTTAAITENLAIEADILRPHVDRFVQTLRELNTDGDAAGFQTYVGSVHVNLKTYVEKCDTMKFYDVCCTPEVRTQLRSFVNYFHTMSSESPAVRSAYIDFIDPCLKNFLCAIAENRHTSDSMLIKNTLRKIVSVPAPQNDMSSDVPTPAAAATETTNADNILSLKKHVSAAASNNDTSSDVPTSPAPTPVADDDIISLKKHVAWFVELLRKKPAVDTPAARARIKEAIRKEQESLRDLSQISTALGRLYDVYDTNVDETLSPAILANIREILHGLVDMAETRDPSSASRRELTNVILGMGHHLAEAHMAAAPSVADTTTYDNQGDIISLKKHVAAFVEGLREKPAVDTPAVRTRIKDAIRREHNFLREKLQEHTFEGASQIHSNIVGIAHMLGHLPGLYDAIVDNTTPLIMIANIRIFLDRLVYFMTKYTHSTTETLKNILLGMGHHLADAHMAAANPELPTAETNPDEPSVAASPPADNQGDIISLKKHVEGFVDALEKKPAVDTPAARARIKEAIRLEHDCLRDELREHTFDGASQICDNLTVIANTLRSLPEVYDTTADETKLSILITNIRVFLNQLVYFAETSPLKTTTETLKTILLGMGHHLADAHMATGAAGHEVAELMHVRSHVREFLDLCARMSDGDKESDIFSLMCDSEHRYLRDRAETCAALVYKCRAARMGETGFYKQRNALTKKLEEVAKLFGQLSVPFTHSTRLEFKNHILFWLRLQLNLLVGFLEQDNFPDFRGFLLETILSVGQSDAAKLWRTRITAAPAAADEEKKTDSCL
jgi:hypothetical protein